MNILELVDMLKTLDEEKINERLEKFADVVALSVVEKISGELEELLSVRAEFKIGDE